MYLYLPIPFLDSARQVIGPGAIAAIASASGCHIHNAKTYCDYDKLFNDFYVFLAGDLINFDDIGEISAKHPCIISYYLLLYVNFSGSYKISPNNFFSPAAAIDQRIRGLASHAGLVNGDCYLLPVLVSILNQNIDRDKKSSLVEFSALILTVIGGSNNLEKAKDLLIISLLAKSSEAVNLVNSLYKRVNPSRSSYGSVIEETALKTKDSVKSSKEYSYILKGVFRYFVDKHRASKRQKLLGRIQFGPVVMPEEIICKISAYLFLDVNCLEDIQESEIIGLAQGIEKPLSLKLTAVVYLAMAHCFKQDDNFVINLGYLSQYTLSSIFTALEDCGVNKFGYDNQLAIRRSVMNSMQKHSRKRKCAEFFRPYQLDFYNAIIKNNILGICRHLFNKGSAYMPALSSVSIAYLFNSNLQKILLVPYAAEMLRVASIPLESSRRKTVVKSLMLKLDSNNGSKLLLSMLDAEINDKFHFIEKKITELEHNASTDDQRVIEKKITELEHNASTDDQRAASLLFHLKYKTSPQNHTGSPKGPKKARRYV